MAQKKAQTPSKSSLYAQAQKQLRERHKEEFNQLVQDAYAEHGMTYRPRLTPEQREARKREREREHAEELLRKLKERHPILNETE